MSPTRRPATAVLGTGRLARALLAALPRAGYPVSFVVGRSARSARSAARRAPGARATTDPARVVEESRLMLLAVPDPVVADVATRLAESVPRGWRGRVVLHHAGALDLEPLAPLRERGASVGLVHPMQCVGPGPDAVDEFPGTRARIEGTPAAVRAARRLARDLGWVPLRLTRALGAGDRAAYHAAASLVSNDLLSLLLLGADVLASAGVDRDEGFRALVELARGTLRQAARGGPGHALSGPVPRGDVARLLEHLRVLGARSPSAERAHRVLSERLVALARDELGVLDRRAGRAIERGLRRPAAGPRRSPTV